MTYLPEELLFQITGHLVGTVGETTALATLSRTSRSLHAFAQPFLYRKFVKPHKDVITEQTITSRPLTRLEVFLRTLIERPDLASLVESLTLAEFQDDDMDVGSDSDEDSSPFDSTLADLFVTAARNISEGEDDTDNSWQVSWHAELRDGNPDAEVALLLTLVPNLRHLDITSLTENLGVYVDDICKQSQTKYNHGDQSQLDTPAPFFSKLESLTLRGTEEDTDYTLDPMVDDHWNNRKDDERTLQLAECNNLMNVPTLKTLTVHRVSETFDYYDYNTWNVAHIVNLTFSDCLIHPRVYKDILETCLSLQSLEISFPCTEIDVSEDFLEKLQALSSTLESLVLVLPKRFDDLTTATLFEIYWLTKLKTLEVECMLLGLDFNDGHERLLHKSLPTSLESLAIRRCHIHMKPHLEDLMDNMDMFPDLKSVELDICSAGGNGWEQEEEVLISFLEDAVKQLHEAGVRLSYKRVEGPV